jgi:phosphate uptake regulator
MKRRLVKQGAATMMVSLPAKWIQQNKLEKGSEIDLNPVGTNLMISAKPVDTKTETEIALLNLTESSIRTLITNTYRSGYDIIKVDFKDENQFKILSNVIKTRLIGFEITRREKNKCVVENITEPSADQFDAIIKKIFYSISELFEVTEKRIRNSKEAFDYEEIEERIQKYDNFCRRVISKRKLVNEKSEFLWAFLALIIHGQREIYHLNSVLEGIKASDKVKELLEDAKAVFELIKKAYLEKNISSLAEVHAIEKKLIYKKGYLLLQESKGKENIIIYHLLSSIREFYQANSPLSGLIM